MPDLIVKFVLSLDGKDLLYVDYNEKGEWVDTWYLRYEAGKGLMEWRDDYPTGGWFTNRKKVVMNPGIGWGEFGEIGGFYRNFPKMDPIRSNPPQFMSGTQTVIWESHIPEMTLSNGDRYTDIITMVYQQSWGKKTAGARYYMAKGIGPIALNWIAPDPNNPNNFITTSRMDAIYTVTDGTQKDIQT
jgi:hypothetical protein